MKEALIYWITGCIVFGLVLGYADKESPNDKRFAPTEVVALVATWPTHVIRGFFVKQEVKP